MNNENIQSFLKLGYCLDYKNSKYSFDFSGVDKNKFKEASLRDLTEMGSKLFMNSIENNFLTGTKHVVPISGGLDSRAVLAALLEFTDAKNIYTYTFGTPQTLDYEIGTQIAKVSGTNHTTFPLTEYVYNMDELIDISKRIDHQTVLFHHPPVWRLDEMFNEGIIWSGFMGDPLVGAHYNKKISLEVNAAKTSFIKLNEYQRNIDLISDGCLSFSELIEIKECNQISTIELLDFYNRQLKFVAPHVLMDGFHYKTPFLYPELFNFFLSIDNKYREGQFLYKRILLDAFPRLFSYPVKNNAGLPLGTSKNKVFLKKAINKIQRKLNRNYINKHVNYLDFDKAIRQKDDLTEIIKINIYDLYNRKIIDWLDVRKVYKDHINGKGNYGDALLLLASLEIHMKSKKINAGI